MSNISHPYQYIILFHDDSSAQSLHGLNDLVSVLLGDVLLHHLWCTLDELLAVHQAESKHVLDLLDDLSLGGSLESLKLEGEESLLGGGRSSLRSLFNSRGSSGGSGSETTYGHIGDVEFALQ